MHTQQIADTKLLAINKVKYRAIGILASGSISVILSLVLSKHLGAIGAGISIMIGTNIGNIVIMNIVYRKQADINVKKFFRKCHLPMIVPFCISTAVGLLVKHIISANTIMTLLLNITLYVIMYSMIMWKYYINIKEKQIIMSYVRKGKYVL